MLTRPHGAAPELPAVPGAEEESRPATAAADGPRPSRFRHDGLFWRRLAYWGSTRAPRWCRRVGPAIVGGIAFALLGANRRAAIATQRLIHGARGTGRATWEALRTFVEFAYCVSEAFELQAANAPRLAVEAPEDRDPDTVVRPGQGLIVLTSHFGSWEVGARFMQAFKRPVNVVMAREANPTVEAFQREVRERHGLRVIYSDSSAFSSLNMIHALRCGEVVAIQLDRSAPGQVTRAVPFFGRPAHFQYGPFVLARLSGAQLWPVFVARTGPRRYRILPTALRRVDRRASEAETVAVMADVVRSFEDTVRRFPRQWFQFRPLVEGEAAARRVR